MCWQLDPTEGPGRVRRRMMRAPLSIHSRHIMSETPQREPGGERGRERGEPTDKCKSIFVHIYMYSILASECSELVISVIFLSAL